MTETFRISHRQVETILLAFDTLTHTDPRSKWSLDAYETIVSFLNTDLRALCFCARGYLELQGASAISYLVDGGLLRIKLDDLNAGRVPSLQVLKWMRCAFKETNLAEFEFSYQSKADV